MTVQPFEARDLPEVDIADPRIAEVASELLTATSGFPHPGDYADATMYALRWLRAHPEKADVLLGR